MRHQKKKKTLDRKVGPRKSLMRNLATSLVLHEAIRTTDAKANALRPIIERLITISKAGDLAARRRLLAYLTVERASKKMIDVVGPRYKERAGGYTRIIKLEQRLGDRAHMARIELV